MINVGKYHAGIYCGERVYRVRQWYRYYGLYRRISTGFSVGPFLFWKGSK